MVEPGLRLFLRKITDKQKCWSRRFSDCLITNELLTIKQLYYNKNAIINKLEIARLIINEDKAFKLYTIFDNTQLLYKNQLAIILSLAFAMSAIITLHCGIL